MTLRECPICGRIWFAGSSACSNCAPLRTYMCACPECKKLLDELYKRRVKNENNKG